MTLSTPSTTPWYRQFWPWFIIALPGSVVVAGIAMVFIAFKGADALVDDNYYRAGLAINERLAEDVVARELGLGAELTFDTLSGEVHVAVTGDAEPRGQLQLLLLHPAVASRDQSVELIAVGEGRYRADLEAIPPHRFYLRLRSPGEGWRLDGELDLEVASHVQLRANG